MDAIGVLRVDARTAQDRRICPPACRARPGLIDMCSISPPAPRLPSQRINLLQIAGAPSHRHPVAELLAFEKVEEEPVQDRP